MTSCAKYFLLAALFTFGIINIILNVIIYTLVIILSSWLKAIILRPLPLIKISSIFLLNVMYKHHFCFIFAAFPSDPKIEMSGLLVEGNPVNVSCKVPDVYPFDRLEIELLKGESIMKKKNFLEDVDNKSLETKSLEMTFIPTTEDTGKVLVCQAKLHIDEMEFEPKQRQSTQTLYVNSKYMCDVSTI